MALSNKEFQDLVGIVAKLPSYQKADTRFGLLKMAFTGRPRSNDILTTMSLDSAPIDASSTTIDTLARFGRISEDTQDDALVIFLNHILMYYGGETEEATIINNTIVKRIAENQSSERPIIPSKSLPQNEWRGLEDKELVQEKIIGENTLRPIHYLNLALEAAKAVVKIKLERGCGSGFLCGKDLIITNNHVVASKEEAMNSRFLFNFQVDKNEELEEVTKLSTLEDGFFYTNEELDFTVIQIESTPPNVKPLKLKSTIVNIDDRVSIIQHPGGYFKQISMQNNFVVYADNKVVQYVTSTEPGSSGSPVFNDSFEVVAIHHSGGNLPDPQTQRRYLRNAGSSMVAVMQDIQANHQTLAELIGSNA